MPNLPILDVAIGDYGTDEEAIVQYREQGTIRAMNLGNRGPVRYDANGQIHPEIIDAYTRCGFYILEGVFGPQERADIEHDIAQMLERCPVSKDAPLDRHGRPALGADLKGRTVTWVKPLSDPIGGTDGAYGRHPAKMIEPTAPKGAPEHVVQVILGSLQFSPACLRAYGHPDLLAVAAAINGDDFTPFNEAVWIKHPGLGGSVAWHQDGWTHWENEALDAHTHGFNFMAQLYGCNAANGLWVVPGSNRQGKADIKAMVTAAGSDRLPDAVPVICAPGDVCINSRQAVHGSFANTSPDVRVTINFGFHRRDSVLGVKSGGVHNPISEYNDDYIKQRSRLIGYAIDARQQQYPGETPYTYRPFAQSMDEYAWHPEGLSDLKDYNLQDIGI
jgi:hypothetical protein